MFILLVAALAPCVSVPPILGLPPLEVPAGLGLADVPVLLPAFRDGLRRACAREHGKTRLDRVVAAIVWHLSFSYWLFIHR